MVLTFTLICPASELGPAVEAAELVAIRLESIPSFAPQDSV